MLLRDVFTRIATALPTAREQLRGQLGLTENPGVADDVPSILIQQTAGTYAWKELSVAGHTHANPGITVQSNDVDVDTSVTTLDFSSAFTVGESPEDEANIAPNFGTSAGTIAQGNHAHATTYAPIGATYIVQTADSDLTAEQALGALATGILKNTTTSGVLSIATSGTDYSTYFQPVPGPMPGLTVDPSAVTNLGSNHTYAVYIGRASAAYTTITTQWSVETAAATITWAEVGIGTSPALTLGASASITRRGYTDVSASFNSTGDKTVSITVSGIAVGDHLWALAGSQATTPFQVLKSVGGNLSAGNHQQVLSTRLSTMASPTSFSIATNPVNIPISCMWIGS